MKRRVVVTGIGMVTPLGRDVETTWNGLREGASGVGSISLFDASRFPTRIAAELKEFRLSDYIEDAERWEGHARHTRFALAASELAVEDAGLRQSRIDPSRF